MATAKGELPTAWVGTVDCAGYEWIVVQATESLVCRALLSEWRKHASRNIPLAQWQGPKANCTWDEFSEYFGADVRRLAFGRVEWA